WSIDLLPSFPASTPLTDARKLNNDNKFMNVQPVDSTARRLGSAQLAETVPTWTSPRSDRGSKTPYPASCPNWRETTASTARHAHSGAAPLPAGHAKPHPHKRLRARAL